MIDLLTALPDDDSGFHSVRRLPMHALRRPAEIDLDGQWDFRLLTIPADAEDDDWHPTQVPGLWTMSEDRDPPQYLNVRMPFDETPPTVPASNPVGLYRRRFTVEALPGRRVLHVGAAEGYLRVLLNGRLVGTSNDSHLAAEFDVTELLVPGENTLVLVVTKWSALSYLEDQDQWWQSGLSRSIRIIRTPATRLADASVTADYDPATGLGSLTVEIATAGLPDPVVPAHRVRVALDDWLREAPVTPLVHHGTLNTTTAAVAHDRSIRPEALVPPDIMDLFSDVPAGAPLPPHLAETATTLRRDYLVPRPAAGSASVHAADLAVEPWSAERPALRTLSIELIDDSDVVVDAVTLRIGFRRVEISGRDLLVNGRRIVVQGVNRHDTHPRTGRVLTREETFAELAQLKRFNVNAIRTSHYPNDPAVLEICDEIGLYVVDEADLEGHAFMDALCGDPVYLPAFVERVSRMVVRDRNHPSVIVFSLGNETGYGANHDAAAAWLRRFDPTRPVMYEGAVSKDWHGGHAASDIACPMYPTLHSLASYSADPRSDRPLILAEYAYSQGNSTGGLDACWELFDTLPGLQGGFLWEYLDHALDPDGDGRYRSGGDFGDRPNDGDVLLNGIAFADGTPKPALFEARGVFSPARLTASVEEARAGVLRVRNRRASADWADLRFTLHVDTRDGAAALTPVHLEAPPGGTAETVLPDAVLAALAGETALGLTLTVATRDDADWAPAGTILAEEQLALPVAAPEPTVAERRPVALDENGDLEHPLLLAPPRLCLWRAETDNDRSTPLDHRFVRSGFFALERQAVRVTTGVGESVVETTYRAAYGDLVEHRRTISAGEDGDLLVAEEVELPEGTTDGMRVGVRFELIDGFDRAEWTGLGPWENYPDRRSSARRGRWSAPIDDLTVPYLPPQENGGRGEVTELRLSGPAGVVATEHAPALQMSVGRYSVEQLEAAAHWWELPASGRTVVHLDVAHRGLGTGALGPDTAPRFRLDGTAYRWIWRLSLRGRD